MKYKYYKTKHKRYAPNDVFVYLGNLECYCPIGQHGTLSADYLKECKEITKNKYLEVTEGIYTPKEYLV